MRTYRSRVSQNSCDGIRSQNQNESLRTLSPRVNPIRLLNDGPSKMKEWNSPRSPQGSTSGGSAARNSSSIILPANDSSSASALTQVTTALKPSAMNSRTNRPVSLIQTG